MSDEFVLVPPSSNNSDDYVVIPEDSILDAELLSVAKKTKPFKDDNNNPVVKVEFSFRVTEDGEYRNQRIWGETSTAFVKHVDCKLYSWVKSILDLEELREGFKFSTDDLVNRNVRIVTKLNEWTGKDGEPRARAIVDDVLPRETTFGSAPVAAPSAVTASVFASSFNADEGEPPF